MIFRGAVYEIKAMPGARGSEQQGRRYAVIIQSDQFATSTITIALTSASAGAAVYRPEIEIDGTTSRILTDQIYSVAPERLGEFKGALDAGEVQELDRALLLKLGLF
ncbi:type II toxin-antitoxin system PemK/MazF family toxin [Phytomonospora endophytica]|uniref:mRNA interferase MazF n=1 Tax=Phytomonospora endophytica TaxID=714109 RepID=A0A841FJT7_9ACTN|nr:type II toxin-antitoxin system PemK/MazF family toxin [Phytomonospora endophytica]MBB6034098.1 mRNA interferase MazF [Phytomonospora endophytica]GIG66492.1 putative toxin [Phytomonospora endophytica]